jgi:hypothetical protein
MAYSFTVTTVINEVNITPNAANQFTITNVTRELVIGNPGSIVIGGGGSGGNATYGILTVTNHLTLGTQDLNTRIWAHDGALEFGYAGNSAPFSFITPTAEFSGAVNINNTLTVGTSQISTVDGYLVFNNTTGTVISNELAVTGTLTLDNATIDSPTPVNFLTGITSANSATFASVITNGVVNTGYTNSGITGTNAVTVASFDATAISAAKYFIQITDGSAFELIEVMVTYDGTDIYANEYGIVTNTGLLGEFNHTVYGSLIQTTFTPNSASNMKIRVAATTLSL